MFFIVDAQERRRFHRTRDADVRRRGQIFFDEFPGGVFDDLFFGKRAERFEVERRERALNSHESDLFLIDQFLQQRGDVGLRLRIQVNVGPAPPEVLGCENHKPLERNRKPQRWNRASFGILRRDGVCILKSNDSSFDSATKHDPPTAAVAGTNWC